LMDILVEIKRLVLKGRIAFTEKAAEEMIRDDLDEDAVCEAILNAPSIAKRLRSKNPDTGAKESLYVIVGLTYDGVAIYTKGKILKAWTGSMSSSLRKKTSPKLLESDSLADFHCAQCGKKSTVKRTRGNYKFNDGTVVRNLAYFRCTHCNAVVFDLPAMKEIRRQRAQRIPSTKSVLAAGGRKPKNGLQRRHRSPSA
jgi:hypothetical protein